MLPLNHYVTLEYLVRHLNKIASYSDQTGMTIKNLGIVWSPNLLRSKELETLGGIGALQCISIQAVLTEYLIRFCDDLFNEESRPFNYFDSQDNNLNGSFLGENLSSFNQSNTFSPTSSRQNQTNLLNDSQANSQLSKNQEDQILEADENHFESSQQSSNSIDSNKFPIKDSNLITLKEARSRWKNKCKLLDEDKSIDQLISSNLNMKGCSNSSLDDKNESSFSLVGPCLASLSTNKNSSPSSMRNYREDKNDENKYEMNDSLEDDQPKFGVLGKFNSTRRKRFGNLDLVDEEDLYKESKSFVSKRRTLFEKGLNKQDEECRDGDEMENGNSKNKLKDRFRYKNFEEQSEEELDLLNRSNNSLKLSNSRLDQSNEPIQRYHTILNPKHFNKNKIITSTPKELNPNLFSKRTPAKWKPVKF